MLLAELTGNIMVGLMDLTTSENEVNTLLLDKAASLSTSDLNGWLDDRIVLLDTLVTLGGLEEGYHRLRHLLLVAVLIPGAWAIAGDSLGDGAFLNVSEEKDHLAYQTYQGFVSMASGGLGGSGIGGSCSVGTTMPQFSGSAAASQAWLRMSVRPA